MNKKTSNYYIIKYKKLYPWRFILYDIRKRCTNPKAENYKNYGGRGIECHLTREEIEYLWFRDKAYLMDKPSIDRKDNDGHYTVDNCQFIEFGKNVAERNKRVCSITVLQYDLDGNFIKEWESLREVERELSISHANISSVLQQKRKTAGGYKWKLKEKK